MSGLLLCDDLIFASKVTATARAHGLSVRVARSPEQLAVLAAREWPAGVVLDLHVPGLDVAEVVRLFRGQEPVPRLVGFGSHVDAERLRAARLAGCDLVLPRSAFVAKLETDLPAWLQFPGAEQGA